MKKLVTIVLTMAILAMAGTAMAAVESTPHDYRGGADYGLCNACHTPHAAKDSNRIWQADVTWGLGNTWAQSNIGQLCGGCHLAGGVLIAQNSSGNSPHDVVATAYAAASHGRTMATLGAGAGNINDQYVNAAGRPYLTNTYMECSSCHDPHDNSVMPFLRNDGGAMDTVTEVCADCHDRAFSGTQGTGNTTTRTFKNDGSGSANNSSMHPANWDYGDADGNEGDTTLATVIRSLTAANPNGALLTTAIDQNNWVLGGKFVNNNAGAATNNIGCETCHAVHGDVDTGAPTNIYLLAITNNGSISNSPLCETCHGGGAEGGVATFTAANDGNGGVNVVGQFYVGRNYLAADAGGQPYDDHPIDIDPDGVPALVAWADANNERWERSTGAGDPMAASGRWPTGAVPGSPYVENGVNMGRIVCVSCHSAHNGLARTSLRRKGGIAIDANTNPVADATDAYMAAATGDDARTAWCYNCHVVSDTVPSFHHSTNDTSAVPAPANYDTNDMLGNPSNVNCGSCHLVSSGVLQAHNGFFNLDFATYGITGNGGSELCIACHNGVGNDNGNPVTAGAINAGNGHTIVASNGTGTGSHYIGTFREGGTWDINVKRGYWRQVTYKGVLTNIYSKYGGNTDTHHTIAPAPYSASQKVVCESCHSVLFNAGWDGVGTWDANHGGATKWAAEGGWKTNLLLQLYEDRGAGVGQLAANPTGYSDSALDDAGGIGDVDGIDTGVGLCIQCHNSGTGPANAGTGNGLVLGSVAWDNAEITHTMVPRAMHPMTGWTITRALDTGRATGNGVHLETVPAQGSYADSAYYPGSGSEYHSYPGEDKMDCDSCHTPHRAMTAGQIPVGPRTQPTNATVQSIVHEVDGLGTLLNGREPDDTCLGCHDR